MVSTEKFAPLLENLIETLPESYSVVDREMIMRAYRFAEEAHKEQKRASGEPYITHPLAVATILRELSHARLPRLRWAVQICALLEGLSNAGVIIADANSNRFNVDPQGHLWLVDLWPLRGADVERAHAENLEHARVTCRELLNQAPCYSLAEGALQQLEAATSIKQLASIF